MVLSYYDSAQIYCHDTKNESNFGETTHNAAKSKPLTKLQSPPFFLMTLAFSKRGIWSPSSTAVFLCQLYKSLCYLLQCNVLHRYSSAWAATFTEQFLGSEEKNVSPQTIWSNLMDHCFIWAKNVSKNEMLNMWYKRSPLKNGTFFS